MNEILSNFLIYLSMLAFGAFVMNFATMGLPLKVLNVRAGMGKKVVVFVRSLTGVYYKTGTFDGTDLVWRARGDKRSQKRRLDIKDGAPIFRSWGVQCVYVDEVKNAFLNPAFDGVQGHDAIKTDQLITRALTAPKIQDKKELVIIILLVIVLLGVIYAAYQSHATAELVKTLATVQGAPQ